MVRGSLPASFPADPDSPLKSRRTPGPAEPIHPDQERCRNCTAPSLSFGLLGFSVQTKPVILPVIPVKFAGF